MKKSRIAKFALLGASTAALAATLTTSTYAWYVSNKTATVKAGEGHTGSAGADGSVLLSWNGAAQNAVWAKELSFTDTTNGAPNITNVKLTPVHDDGTGFFGVNTDGTKPQTDLAANLTTGAGSYLQFTIYAKTESSTPISVTPSIVINNTTQALTGLEQLAYVGTADGSPVAAGTNFVYNCLDSLYVKQSTTASTGSGNSATAGALTANTYVAASKSGTRGTTTVSSGWTDHGEGNAHSYFANVANVDLADIWVKTPACTDSGNDAGTLSDLVLTQDYIAITYTIFLDGGDEDCFNSCAGQDISFEVKFQVNDQA